MKLLFKILSLSAILAMSLSFIQCKQGDQEKLETFVKEFNKTCPQEVAGIVRLDRAEALPDKTIKMYTTIYDNDGTLGNKVVADMVSKSVGAQIVRATATSPEMKPLRDMSVTFIVSMQTNKGFEFEDITVTPEEYNNFETQAQKGNTGAIAELQTSVDAIQALLPYTDPDSGLTIKEAYIENGNTMVTVCSLPEKARENIKQNRETVAENMKAAAKQNITTDQGMIRMLNKGAVIKYIYHTPDGETLVEVVVSKDDL